MNDPNSRIPNVSVQRRYAAGAVEGHLARGVLLNPMVVQVYAGDLDVDLTDGSLPALDVLIGPVDGQRGPVERFPVAAATIVQDARLPGTGIAFLMLPAPSSYRIAAADVVDLGDVAAELSARAGEADGSAVYDDVVTRRLLPEAAAAGDDLRGWLADVERAERLVPQRFTTEQGPMVFQWPPHIPNSWSWYQGPGLVPIPQMGRPDPSFPFPFPWQPEPPRVVASDRAAVLDLRESARAKR